MRLLVSCSAHSSAPCCSVCAVQFVIQTGISVIIRVPLSFQEKTVWLPSPSAQGKWILVTKGPKWDSKSFREEGNSGLEVNTGKNFYIYYMHVIYQRPRLEKEQASVQRTIPPLVSWISITSVTVFSFPAYRREKGQWEGQIVGTPHLSFCFLQMQHWALSVGRIVLGVEQLIRKSCQFFIKPCFPPACRRSGRQVTKMIASSKVITLANRSFEVNQSILVYDPTMDRQKSLKPPFVAGNDSKSALEIFYFTYLSTLSWMGNTLSYLSSILDGNFVLSLCLTWCASRRDAWSGKSYYFCPSRDMGDILVQLCLVDEHLRKWLGTELGA